MTSTAVRRHELHAVVWAEIWVRIGRQVEMATFTMVWRREWDPNVCGPPTGDTQHSKRLGILGTHTSGTTLRPTNFGYLGLHITSDLPVSIAPLANAVASG